jgi:hypothetical protein
MKIHAELAVQLFSAGNISFEHSAVEIRLHLRYTATLNRDQKTRRFPISFLSSTISNKIYHTPVMMSSPPGRFCSERGGKDHFSTVKLAKVAAVTVHTLVLKMIM